MEDTNRNIPWGWIAAALAGAAVGATVALLFAPKSGKETREQLGDWLKEATEKGREKFETTKEQLVAAYQAGKKAYTEPVKS